MDQRLVATMIKYGVSEGDTVYLLLDTSGGMDYPSGYLSGLIDLQRITDLKLVVITCDNEVQNVGHFTSAALDDLKTFEIHRGGETRFTPAFEAVKADWKGSKPAKVFYVTDGIADRQGDTSNIDPMKFDVVWIYDQRVCLNATACFGGLPGRTVYL